MFFLAGLGALGPTSNPAAAAAESWAHTMAPSPIPFWLYRLATGGADYRKQDSKFQFSLQNEMMAFQKHFGLAMDGTMGPETARIVYLMAYLPQAQFEALPREVKSFLHNSIIGGNVDNMRVVLNTPGKAIPVALALKPGQQENPVVASLFGADPVAPVDPAAPGGDLVVPDGSMGTAAKIGLAGLGLAAVGGAAYFILRKG